MVEYSILNIMTTIINNDILDLNNIENICFEGGGSLGLSYISALKQLDACNLRNKVKNFSGSSVGAVYAAALACNCSLECLETHILILKPKTFKDTKNIFVKACRLYKRNGMYQGHLIKKWMQLLLKNACGNPDITFQEVYDRFNHNLIITGTDLMEQNTEYFSKYTSPNMRVVDALRISVSFPLFFRDVRLNGKIYIDGGVLDNFPIHVFRKPEFGGSLENDSKTIGLKLLTADEYENKPLSVDKITSFIPAVINCLHRQASKVYIEPSDWERTIKINTGNLSSMNFDLTEEEKQFLMVEGKKAVDVFCQKHT